MTPLSVVASQWTSLKRRGLTCGGVVTALLTVLLSAYTFYIHAFNKCDMQSILLPLLQVGARHLSTVNASYWLDYGTLLGAVRDGGLVPWEFDIDMAVMDEDCPKFLTLREAFAKDGLTMYARGEYISHKKSLLMGYDGYLHKACARIYDKDFKYYIDFDWYKRYTYEEAIAMKASQEAQGGLFHLPEGYSPSDGDVLCNIEATEVGWTGGCRLTSWVYPLQPIDVLGVKQLMPSQPEKNFVAMYGPTWRTPRPKGYKFLVCGWMPTQTLAFTLFWLFVTILPTTLYLFGPRTWDRFLIAIGKRNVTYKYATLPTYQR